MGNPLENLASRELARMSDLRVDFAHLGQVADYLDLLASIVTKAAEQAAEANKPLFVGSGHGFALGDPAMAAAAELRDKLAPKPALAQRNLQAVAARLTALSDLVDQARRSYRDESERENAMVQLLQTGSPGAMPGYAGAIPGYPGAALGVLPPVLPPLASPGRSG
jgi:hypothetical protein